MQEMTLDKKKIIAFLDHYKITGAPEGCPEMAGMFVIPRSGSRKMIVIPIKHDELDELIEGLQLLKDKCQIAFEQVE